MEIKFLYLVMAVVFPAEGSYIALLLQDIQQILGIHGILCIVVGTHTVRLAVAAGEHAYPSRHAGWIGCISLRKIHTLLRKGVKKGHSIKWIPCSFPEIVALLVGHNDDNVRFHLLPLYRPDHYTLHKMFLYEGIENQNGNAGNYDY